MEMPSAGGRTPFKDYCQILQLHPDADAEMVDAAYWHLARRYSEALATDPNAKRHLDDLNEAYSVMRSSDRRAEYQALRERMLGVGALPMPPEPEREPMPLPLLEKEVEQLHAWADSQGAPLAGPPGLPKITVPGLQAALAAGLMLLLGITSLSGSPDPALIAAILAIGLAVVAVPLYKRLPSFALPSVNIARPFMPSMPALEGSADDRRALKAKPSGLDPDSLRAQTNAIRERWRGTADPDTAARPRGRHGLHVVDTPPDPGPHPADDEDDASSGFSAA